MPMSNNDSEIASSEWFARKRMRITTFQVGFRITMCVWSRWSSQFDSDAYDSFDFQEKDGRVLALGRSEYGRLGLGEGKQGNWDQVTNILVEIRLLPTSRDAS